MNKDARMTQFIISMDDLVVEGIDKIDYKEYFGGRMIKRKILSRLKETTRKGKR